MGLFSRACNGIPGKEAERFWSYVYPYAYQGFQAGKSAYARELQKVFLLRHAQHAQREVAQAFQEKLQMLTVKGLIVLSEESWGSIFLYDEGYDDFYIRGCWKRAMDKARHSRESFPHLTDAQYLSVLCMGTFHANGYYRQMCLEALRRCGLTLPSRAYGLELSPLPFYLLRINDWVPEIRETAQKLAMEEISHCNADNLLLVLPALEKVRNSHRRESCRLKEIDEAVLGRLRQELPDGDLSMLKNMDINSRNAVYLFLQREPLLPLHRMERLLQDENTGYGKRLLFAGIVRFYASEQLDIDKFLADKCADVRYCALNYKYDKQKDAWAGLEGMLLDDSAKVRGMAAFMLRRHQAFDVVGFYRDRLEEFGTKWKAETDCSNKLFCRKCCRISLLGIGENGSRENKGLPESYMRHPDSGMVRAAMRAYGMLMQEQGKAIYWEFLVGDSPEYALTAYKLIVKYRISYDSKELYEMYLKKKGGTSAELFLRLLLRGPSWSRLEYLLELCDAGELSEAMRALILKQCGRRNMYARLDTEQVRRLREVLERKREVLPETLVKEILFDLKYVS